jgi:hypothetical protein
MNEPEVLNGMSREMVRRGLPADYANRAVAELADHHRDLVDEVRASGISESHAEIEASRRLGNPSKLVRKTVREFQTRYWCGRWPLITFLFGPVPLLVATWLAIWIPLAIVAVALAAVGVNTDMTFDGIISTQEYVTELCVLIAFWFVAPAITMLALARLAKRAALNGKWLLISACVLGLTVGTCRTEFPQPSTHPMLMDGRPVPADQPILMVGGPFFANNLSGAYHWYTEDTQQTCQLLLPLAVAAIAALRMKQLALRSSKLISTAC